MLWILFAVLTVAAALAVLVPLARAGRAGERGQDVAIYKDQLAEVDRDLERGVIEQAEAEAARTEIARRLLQASRQEADEGEGASARSGAGFRRKAASAVAVLVVPLAALGLYISFGSPQLADQPLAPRLAANGQTPEIELLVAKVEGHLADNPEDGRGWAVLAPVYMRLGRAEEAVAAYANAIRLLGETARMRTDMGEAMVVANAGVVSADAYKAFERAAELEPAAVKPRFFLAVALSQEGRRDEAVAAWQALLSEADGSEAWVPAAKAELAALGGEVPQFAEAPQGLPGPTGADVAAASQMEAGDRQQMITDMVARLDERLASEGGSLEEWTRLVRAYLVLGNRDGARDALSRARGALAQDADALAALERLAAESGLNS